MDSALAAHTEDLVLRFAGTSSIAGTYEGKPACLTFYGKFVEAAGGFSREFHDYLATDSHGDVLMKTRYERAGTTLQSDETYVCHFP